MALALTPDEHTKLVELACQDFYHGHLLGMRARHTGRVSARAGEVIMVSHFCLSMMDAARSWNVELQRIGKPYALTVSTVFTHQRPYVRFTSNSPNPGCEMADMLVVVVDRTTPAPTGTALLLQAKLSDQHYVNLTNASERKQFELFAQHPAFNMRAGGPQGVILPLATARAGLLYGITGAAHIGPRGVHIFPWPWHPHAWYNSSPIAGGGLTYRADARECIAHMLVDMLTMQAGSAFVPSHAINTAAPSSWDDVINYLLQTTYYQPLNARNRANAGRPMRGDSVLMVNRGSGGTFFAAHTTPSDPVGPTAWIEVDASEDGPSKEAWREGSINDVDYFLESLVKQFSSSSSGGGGDVGEPPVGAVQEYGSISTVVIEIVNNEGAQHEE
jgi:hypothetical protein